MAIHKYYYDLQVSYFISILFYVNIRRQLKSSPNNSEFMCNICSRKFSPFCIDFCRDARHLRSKCNQISAKWLLQCSGMHTEMHSHMQHASTLSFKACSCAISKNPYASLVKKILVTLHAISIKPSKSITAYNYVRITKAR